jgi:hypothetical protein
MFSRSVNDTSRVVKLTIIGDATTWSITYDCRSGDPKDVIYNCQIFIVQASLVHKIFIHFLQNRFELRTDGQTSYKLSIKHFADVSKLKCLSLPRQVHPSLILALT